MNGATLRSIRTTAMLPESNAVTERVLPVVELGDRLRVADIALVCSVPLILGLVALLPRATRRSFVFDYTAPTVPTAFVSVFVHLDSTHLLVNLGLYALVVPVVLALAVTGGRRRRFYTVFVTFLGVFPIALSYLNLAIPRPAAGFGFSGIVMAFAGYLPLALGEYLESRFDVGPASQLAPVLFLTSLSLVSVLSLRSVFGLVGRHAVGLALAAFLGALWYGLAVTERSPDLRGASRRLLATPWAAELVAVAVILVFAVPFVSFPAAPGRGSGVLNLYAHLLGYALGFLVPFVTTTATGFASRS
jgi:hypothetical protein